MKRYLRCTLLDSHPTMTVRTPGVPIPKAMINRPTALKLLDPKDPNDNVFKLVITFVLCCDVYFPKKTQYSALFLPYPHDPFHIHSIPPRPILHSLHTIVTPLGGLSWRYSAQSDQYDWSYCHHVRIVPARCLLAQMEGHQGWCVSLSCHAI